MLFITKVNLKSVILSKRSLEKYTRLTLYVKFQEVEFMGV